MISNPLDPSVMGDTETMTRVLKLASGWDGVDMVVGDTSATWFLDFLQAAEHHESNLQAFIKIAGQVQKPMAVIITAGDTTTTWRVEGIHRAQKNCRKAGIPVYPSIRRAARALALFTMYHRRKETLQSQSDP